MHELPKGFEQFEFSEQQIQTLRCTFKLIIEGSRLLKDERTTSTISRYKKIPGIYFWVMRDAGRLFRIYVGKTNNMSYRFDNYISEYQPHSPNDFKMRIFRTFVMGILPTAELDLYFVETDLPTLTEAENLAIKTYRPLLNSTLKPTSEAREKLRDAFSAYYQSSFEHLIFGSDKSNVVSDAHPH